jgi:hypothetical protein
MAELKGECVYIRLYFKWKKNAMEALRMLKVAVGGQVLERTPVCKRFCTVSGVNCAENTERVGCPMTVKRMKLWIE